MTFFSKKLCIRKGNNAFVSYMIRWAVSRICIHITLSQYSSVFGPREQVLGILVQDEDFDGGEVIVIGLGIGGRGPLPPFSVGLSGAPPGNE